MKFFLLYILFINIFSFTLMLIDKKKAIKKKEGTEKVPFGIKDLKNFFKTIF